MESEVRYRKINNAKLHSQYLVAFFVTEKKYLMSSLAISVRPSVRPSFVEISLERGCTITNRPIDLKFDINIGSDNACLKGAIFRNSNCKLQIYAI